jgi:TRAP-type transport system large permease protein
VTLAVFTCSLLGAMALGMPIAFALIVCGVALMHSLQIFDSQIVAQNIINGADSFPLMAVPFFMLAGELMNRGGLARRIVNVALAMVGHVKGGLGYVTILAACVLSSLSGSAAADAAALAALLVPMMVAAGHRKMDAAGLVAASGVIGPVIPPSIGFVLFGVTAGVSISKLFLAGIFPGLMLGVGLCFAWWWVTRGENIGSPERKSLREIAWAIVDGFWALMLPAIILVGLRFGVFTPTEAAVVAVVYAIIVGMAVYREISFAYLLRAFVRTGVTSGIVMLLIGGANIFAWLMTVSGVPAAIAGAIQSMGGGKTVFLSMSIVVFLPLFALLDGLPGMLMIMPVFVPIAQQLGIDLIHYGILMTTVMGVALFLPPFGVGLYIVLGLSGATIGETSRHLLPYLATMTAVTVVIAFVPWIVFLIPYVFNLYTPL